MLWQKRWEFFGWNRGGGFKAPKKVGHRRHAFPHKNCRFSNNDDGGVIGIPSHNFSLIISTHIMMIVCEMDLYSGMAAAAAVTRQIFDERD